MRIIGGSFKGTKLYTLEGENTRPTLDRVKESLFNIIQFKLQDIVFLDLFAGSGAIGLEALSRGARKTIFCDNSKQAINIIKKNVEKTNTENKVEIFNISCEELINEKINEKIDIVYIDPPYQTNLAYLSVDHLIKRELLNDDSIIIVETDREEIINEIQQIENIEIYDKRKYGRAYLIFLRYIRKG